MKIYTHPDNLDELCRQFPAPPEFDSLNGHFYSKFAGVEIIASPYMDKYVKEWRFPRSAFTNYERSDEKWAVPLGFGRWVTTDEPLFMKIDDYDFKLPKLMITNVF